MTIPGPPKDLKIMSSSIASSSSKTERLERLYLQISSAEERLVRLEEAWKARQRLERDSLDPVTVVKQDLLRRGVYTTQFFTVPENYYDLTLEQRAALLGGHESQLCKTIIFENVACEHNDCSDPTDSKYYLVIIQYIAKINTQVLRNFVHTLKPPEVRLSKKKFNFQLASEEKV